MSGTSEEEKLLRYVQENAPAALAGKAHIGVIEQYLGVIHDYVEEHNEPVNSPESEQWVLDRFIALQPGFSPEEARKLMDLELDYWEAAEEGDENGEEEDFFDADDE